MYYTDNGYDAGVVGGSMGTRFAPVPTVRRWSDSAIASGSAFLISELDKRDPRIREPLTSYTYSRDVPIKVGGGWVEYVSAIAVDFGVTGGSSDGVVSAPGSNGAPVVQANLSQMQFSTHDFSAILRVPFVDLQREQITGRSLDALLSDGVRLAYDKHLDCNCYRGLSAYNTPGLLNNADVTVVSATEVSSQTAWEHKTPDEILADINSAIVQVWSACGYDRSALPNHVLVPYEQYNILATTKVSDVGEKTILEFLLDNNITKRNGGELFIGATAWCKEAGADNKDRMVVYCHNDRFLAMEELVPLSRTMTQPNVDALSYDSVYMANISQLEVYYPQTILYVDGI